MKHIHYLLLSVLLAFSSCQNNEETVIENNFKGHYKITAMESDQPLDLNNDGISSSNLYEEIAAPVHGNNKDETPIPFYHFEEWSNYAEVRPAFDDQPDYSKASFARNHFSEPERNRTLSGILHTRLD